MCVCVCVCVFENVKKGRKVKRNEFAIYLILTVRLGRAKNFPGRALPVLAPTWLRACIKFHLKRKTFYYHYQIYFLTLFKEEKLSSAYNLEIFAYHYENIFNRVSSRSKHKVFCKILASKKWFQFLFKLFLFFF